MDFVEQKLSNILFELDKYKRDKNDLIKYYISQRLTKSLHSYYSDITKSFDYIKYKDELRIAKNLNKDIYNGH